MKMVRRGISPVIAAVLLVLITVAAGVMIWVWLSGFASKNPTTQPALEERLKIESYGIKKDVKGYDVTLYVRNIGGVPVKIVDVYFMNASGVVAKYDIPSDDVYVDDTPGIKAVVNPGNVIEITIANVSLDAGYSYTVKLVSEHGTEFWTTITVPSG